MTQEGKELLLKDLCARLPYKVKVYNTAFKEATIQTLYGKISNNEFLMEETYTSVGIDGDDFGSFNKRHYTGYVDLIKPYLRPMSSMTEEEEDLLAELNCYYDNKGLYFSCGHSQNDICEVINFLNFHHFDYRGLIEKGLALEAPKDMYNIK